MTLVFWATLLIAIALLLMLAELLLPSGGILGIFATAAWIGAMVCLFLIDVTAGMIGVVISILVVPVLVVLGVKALPHTPIGRRTFLQESQKANFITYDRNVSRSGKELVGQEGVAETELRPVGTVKLDGKRLECFSEAGVILAGTAVKVTRVQGMEIKVRPID